MEMLDDDMPSLDGQVFASICTICATATVLCIDEHKKFQTVECHVRGDVLPSEPRQFDPDTCKYARHLVLSTAISEISSFDSVAGSADFVIDAEIFCKRWNAGLDMMGWKPVVSAPPPDFDGNPRLGALLVTGILCETCRDVIAVELEDGGIQVVVCPFDG